MTAALSIIKQHRFLLHINNIIACAEVVGWSVRIIGAHALAHRRWSLVIHARVCIGTHPKAVGQDAHVIVQVRQGCTERQGCPCSTMKLVELSVHCGGVQQDQHGYTCNTVGRAAKPMEREYDGVECPCTILMRPEVCAIQRNAPCDVVGGVSKRQG